MKLLLKIFRIAIILFGITQCTSTYQDKNAQIKFEIKEYDFGEVEQNSEARCSFIFTNSGKTPLIVQNVKTSCGCTVPQWPTKPLNPHKREEIEIHYDTSYPGIFNKTITVFYNGQNSPETLTIKGHVIRPTE